MGIDTNTLCHSFNRCFSYIRNCAGASNKLS